MATSRLSFSEETNRKLINQFYTAFSAGDADKMVSCYHQDVVFTDPAFGILKGEKAGAMWHMLVERSKGQLQITFDSIEADAYRGSAHWVAEYVFSATGRKVVNRISARFEFQDGLIIRHTDHFEFWRWARQALGWKGWLLGWTNFMQQKMQQQTTRALEKHMRAKK